MEKCKICGKEFDSLKGLSNHILRIHKISIQKYYDQYNSKGICLVCGKPTKFKNLNYGYNKTCCIECNNIYSNRRREETNLKKYGIKYSLLSKEVKEKTKKTLLDLYGVDHISKAKFIKEKKKETSIKKYGKEYYSQSEEWKNRVINSNLSKYGVKYYSQSKDWKDRIILTNLKLYNIDNYAKSAECKKKVEETNLERYGTKCDLQNEEVHKKTIKTNLEKYGNESYLKSKIYKEKINKSNIDNYQNNYNGKVLNFDGSLFTCICDKCGKEFKIDKWNFYNRLNVYHSTICTICNPLYKEFSIEEKELTNYIKSIYTGKVIENDRIVLDGKELDIYLPDKNLAFEYDGLYWHNELKINNTYHLDKTKLCLTKNIQLIHIFENEWIYKQDIIKSRIASLLGINKHIYARKCECKLVNYYESKQFLNENHLQGNCISKYKYGLYYDNELVSLMTFGKSRFGDEFEMLRFCNKLTLNVIGGASKLFKHFLNDHKEIKEVISYADRRWSIGNLYDKLDFKLNNISKPNYYYIFGNILKNRLEFQKHKLIKEGYDKNKSEHEIMLERKIYRIYDCGNLKYKYVRGM